MGINVRPIANDQPCFCRLCWTNLSNAVEPLAGILFWVSPWERVSGLTMTTDKDVGLYQSQSQLESGPGPYHVPQNCNKLYKRVKSWNHVISTLPSCKPLYWTMNLAFRLVVSPDWFHPIRASHVYIVGVYLRVERDIQHGTVLPK